MSPSDSVSFSVPRIPMAINKLMRAHWAVRRRNKDEWQTEILVAAGRKQMAIMRAWVELEHRVNVEIAVHHAQEFDFDNLYSCAKNLLDGMKKLRLIVDDSPRHIELHISQVKSKRAEARTEFKLSRIE